MNCTFHNFILTRDYKFYFFALCRAKWFAWSMIISISGVLEEKIYGVKARAVQRPCLEQRNVQCLEKGDKGGLSTCDFLL